MAQCSRIVTAELYTRQCEREAVYKGYCRACAWVELPDERELLPEKVKRIPKPKKAKRAHPEDDLQMVCCELLEQLPATLFWSTPNHLWLGDGNKYAQANYIRKQKMMGMQVGACDLNILFRNKHGASTFVLCELKIKPNKPSAEQNSFMDAANGYGAYTGVCYSLDDLLALLRAAGHGSVPTS